MAVAPSATWEDAPCYYLVPYVCEAGEYVCQIFGWNFELLNQSSLYEMEIIFGLAVALRKKSSGSYADMSTGVISTSVVVLSMVYTSMQCLGAPAVCHCISLCKYTPHCTTCQPDNHCILLPCMYKLSTFAQSSYRYIC